MESTKDLSIDPSSPFPYCQSDPNPIGGGNGYTSLFEPSNADIYIGSPLSALDFKNII